MPKKTTIFIIILALIAAGLIALAIRQAGPKTPTQEETPTEEAIEPQALLYFENNQVQAAPGEEMTANIMLDSGEQIVDGVQIYLKYDPAQLTIVSVNPPQDNFFGTNPGEYQVIDLAPVDNAPGIQTFAIGIPPGTSSNSKPRMGVDKVATVTFMPNPTFQGNATIEIVNNTTDATSMVLPPASATSILKSTTPLQVAVE